AAARFGNVAYISRNQMDVQMGNGLSRGRSVVYADRETGRSVSLVYRVPRFGQEPDHFPLLVFCRLEQRGDVAARNDKAMAGAYRERIGTDNGKHRLMQDPLSIEIAKKA